MKITVSVGVVNNRVERLVGPLPENHSRCAPAVEWLSKGNKCQPMNDLLEEGKHASSDKHVPRHLEGDTAGEEQFLAGLRVESAIIQLLRRPQLLLVVVRRKSAIYHRIRSSFNIYTGI